jgi:hypothetical protein
MVHVAILNQLPDYTDTRNKLKTYLKQELDGFEDVDALAGIEDEKQRVDSLEYVAEYGNESASVRAEKYLAETVTVDDVVSGLRAYFEDNQ